MERIDLHVHSTYSDGTLTPTELIQLAHIRNIKAIALSDHDSICGLAEGRAAAQTYGIRFINAIELSSFVGHQEIHILGYFFHNDLSSLESFLSEVREQREKRNKEMATRFSQYGLDISYHDVVKASSGNVITRAHFARALIEKNYVGSVNEAFKRYLSPHSHSSVYVERTRIPSKTTLDIIKAANGISVLAHPIRYGLDSRGVERLVSTLSEQGLQGIEAQYSSYNKLNELELTHLAKTHHLKITGGSDFHGDIKPHIALGDGTEKTMIPYALLDALEHPFKHSSSEQV